MFIMFVTNVIAECSTNLVLIAGNTFSGNLVDQTIISKKFTKYFKFTTIMGIYKLLKKCETQANFCYFYRRKSVLISSGKSNSMKI